VCNALHCLKGVWKALLHGRLALGSGACGALALYKPEALDQLVGGMGCIHDFFAAPIYACFAMFDPLKLATARKHCPSFPALVPLHLKAVSLSGAFSPVILSSGLHLLRIIPGP
jgi:hypothetical protein